jgi:hypothetical protein
VPGNIPGIFISGGNNIKSFYCGMTTEINIIFAGSSFSTQTSISYNQKVRDMVLVQPNYTGQFSTLAVGGAKTWFNLVRLSSYLTSSTQYFILDTANDSTISVLKDQASLEALIRRVWTHNPNIIFILMSAPSWNGQDITNDANTPTPTNRTSIDAARVIGNYYGVYYAAYLDRVISLVAAGHHLNEYVSGDTVHPTDAGYYEMSRLAGYYLADTVTFTPHPLPDRILADTLDYEYESIRLFGINYSARTGVWVNTGTSTASVTAGSTITYTGTFRSFGWYNAAGSYADLSVTIDGGAPINPFNYGWGGYDIGTRAAHTIVITVLTACTIDEFMAI